MQKKNTNQSKKPKAEKILLGIDAHLTKYVVARQFDGATPQPAQRFEQEALLKWAQKQLRLGHEVWSCYEAGPLGYTLHRKLVALGVKNLVIRAKVLDDYGNRVKTDRRDARNLVGDLERYARGNTKALSVVRVPTEEEEQRRSVSRQRESFKRQVQRLAAQGRGISLYYGARMKGEWWSVRRWERLQRELPEHLIERLTMLRPLIQLAQQQREVLTSEVEAAAPTFLPKGLGALTYESIRREIGDWAYFGNRRAIASYTGLCPSEYSSGPKRSQRSITKHGNKRLRPILVEAAWRMLRFQPNYIRLEKWKREMCARKLSPGRKKKMAVAIARCLIVDLWRLNTGRTTMEELGLIPAN